MNNNYRLVKDSPDARDFMFKVAPVATLPAKVDLRPGMPPVYDQGQLGSCSGNAVAAAFQFDQMKEKIPSWNPSRLFIYYNERLIEGTVNEDDGAQLRDGIKAISTYGVCDESVWAYDVSKFAVKPSADAYTEAKTHVAMQYARVGQDLLSLKQTLAGGFPVVVGIMLFEAFEGDDVAQSGMVPMPDPESDQCLGGHAVVVAGYDDSMKCFIMRNSWGKDWGDEGYFYLPYDYLTDPNLGMDFWVVTQVK
jgi:C1A family cysteine protease